MKLPLSIRVPVTCAVAWKVPSDRNMGLTLLVFLSAKDQRFVLSVIQCLKTVFLVCVYFVHLHVCFC